MSATEEEIRCAELRGIALDAVRSGDAEKLRPLLRAGLSINLADDKGNTLLMLACRSGQMAVARFLLERGADTERRNFRGQTPIAAAAFKGNLEMVKLLARYGADVAADQGVGRLPVDFAALLGHTGIVRYLESVSDSGKAVRLLAISGFVGALRSAVGRLRGKSFFFVAGV